MTKKRKRQIVKLLKNAAFEDIVIEQSVPCKSNRSKCFGYRSGMDTVVKIDELKELISP